MEDSEINIMDIDVNNLRQKQYQYLKKHTLDVLNGIIENLKNDQLQAIQYKLKYSPAGDAYGCDNYYINFAYKKDDFMDMNEILIMMAELKNIDLYENE